MTTHRGMYQIAKFGAAAVLDFYANDIKSRRHSNEHFQEKIDEIRLSELSKAGVINLIHIRCHLEDDLSESP